MKIIYVKHFLNQQGIEYFTNSWFPQVNKAIKDQQGFISIESYFDGSNHECVNIILKFQNDETLQAWVKTKIHGQLIDLLEPYRTRDWLWAAVETDNNTDSNELNWNSVYLKHHNDY